MFIFSWLTGPTTRWEIYNQAVNLSLDNKITSVACSILISAGLGGTLVYSAVKELQRGNKLKGACKMLFGLAGVGLTAYLIYNTYRDLTRKPCFPPDTALSLENCKLFAECHRDELNQMIVAQDRVGWWRRLKAGGAKVSLVHPDWPGTIVKIPLTNLGDPKNYLEIHANNVKRARDLIKQNDYYHLVVPESHLVELGNQHITCEKKYEFESRESRPYCPTALGQLSSFVNKGLFCDVWMGQNAEYEKGTHRVVLFDLDCNAQAKEIPFLS